MTITKAFLAALAAFSLLISLESQAGTMIRSASVYAEPSEASTQVLILKASTKVHVTGNQQTTNGTTYVPIEVDQIKGWIAKSAIEIEPGDFEYYPTRHRTKFMNLWASGGFANVDAGNSSSGGRLGLGIDVFPTNDRTLFFGVLYSKPFASEVMTGTYSGSISRSNFLADLGYFFVPDVLYARGMIGFSVVSSSNFNIDSRVEPTFGAGLGYQFYNGGEVSIALEATYEYTERAVSSALGIDTGFDQAFGTFDVSSIIPHASVFAINLVFNISP
jgi:hypothetical protein